MDPVTITLLVILLIALLLALWLLAIYNGLVPRHSGSDWLIPSQFRMGRSSGATRIWMLRAVPG